MVDVLYVSVRENDSAVEIDKARRTFLVFKKDVKCPSERCRIVSEREGYMDVLVCA